MAVPQYPTSHPNISRHEHAEAAPRRLAAQLQAAHRDRANALIERRVRIALREALQLRIQELDEYVESLTRALDGPTYTAMPRTAATHR